MPLIKTISTTDGLISVWQIAEATEELLSYFSAQELDNEEFKKFTFEKRKAEWLATRVLLKQLIGNSFTISYTSSGKPLLEHAQYHYISITHSRTYVAVFIHQNKEIGIDIESSNRNYAPILKKYLSDLELCHIKEDNLIPCLYWCAKEALFKLVEEEGIDFKKQFEILSVEPSEQLIVARYISAKEVKNYQLNYSSFNNHFMVWVSDDPVNIGT